MHFSFPNPKRRLSAAALQKESNGKRYHTPNKEPTEGTNTGKRVETFDPLPSGDKRIWRINCEFAAANIPRFGLQWSFEEIGKEFRRLHGINGHATLDGARSLSFFALVDLAHVADSNETREEYAPADPINPEPKRYSMH